MKYFCLVLLALLGSGALVLGLMTSVIAAVTTFLGGLLFIGSLYILSTETHESLSSHVKGEGDY